MEGVGTQQWGSWESLEAGVGVGGAGPEVASPKDQERTACWGTAWHQGLPLGESLKSSPSPSPHIHIHTVL